MMPAFRLNGGKIQLSENDVEKQCLDLLRLYGQNAIRLHAGTFVSLDGKRHVKGVETGTPDYCVPAYYVETKRPGKRATPEQERKIWELKKFWGLDTAVVSDPDELLEFLRSRGIARL